MNPPNEPVFISGLKLTGDIPRDDVAVSAVVLIELMSADTSERYLRLLSTDLPVWHRLGMLQAAIVSDEADAAQAFEDDTDDQ